MCYHEFSKESEGISPSILRCLGDEKSVNLYIWFIWFSSNMNYTENCWLYYYCFVYHSKYLANLCLKVAALLTFITEKNFQDETYCATFFFFSVPSTINRASLASPLFFENLFSKVTNFPNEMGEQKQSKGRYLFNSHKSANMEKILALKTMQHKIILQTRFKTLKHAVLKIFKRLKHLFKSSQWVTEVLGCTTSTVFIIWTLLCKVVWLKEKACG